jgi:hypothetical protein
VLFAASGLLLFAMMKPAKENLANVLQISENDKEK